MRRSVGLAAAACLCASGSSHAVDEALFVRADSNGLFEAVVEGYRNNVCGPYVTPPPYFLQTGSHFQIWTEPLGWGGCWTPVVPPAPVSERVPLGYLPPGNYTVSWVQPGNFALSQAFTVSNVHRNGFESF